MDATPNYTVVNHEARSKYKLSLVEYCVADLIHNLAFNPVNELQWCFASKETMADFIGCDRATVYRAITKLASLGLIEKNPNRSDLLRTTKRWYANVLMKAKTQDESQNAMDSRKVQQGVPSQNATPPSQNATVYNKDYKDNLQRKEEEKEKTYFVSKKEKEETSTETTTHDPPSQKQADISEKKAKSSEIATYFTNPNEADIAEFTKKFKCNRAQVLEKYEDMSYWWEGLSPARKREYSNAKAIIRNALKKDFGLRPGAFNAQDDFDRFNQQLAERTPYG